MPTNWKTVLTEEEWEAARLRAINYELDLLDRATELLLDYEKLKAENERLRDAIRRHRAYISEENHPGNADKRLWAVLDEEQQ